jgi:hypothetical protein
MRSLAANGNSLAVELIEKADELDKMIDADPWDTEQVLGGILWRGGWCGGSGGTRSIFLAAAEFGYRSQQLASVTERHSNVLEVLIREIRQDGKADVVFGKALRVLPETDFSSQSETCCIAAAPHSVGLIRPCQLV